MTGGDIFHNMMLKHGVTHVFGYPGGAILPVFDAIYKSPHFEFILPRHEQGAGHMAQGYARVTGKPGVVLVTSGPGATNVVTAMQDALSDGTPLIVATGQVPTTAIGSDSFQEADVVGITRACTKWNVMVKDIAELPRRINEAFQIATSGRPGPVLIDLPKDVTAGVLNRPIPSAPVIPARPSPSQAESEQATHFADASLNATLKKVAELIATAKQPVLYVGQGINGSLQGPELLRRLAAMADIPVTTTLLALGAVDESDPRALHMLGMHGSVYANLAMQNADLIIALGARFDDRVTGNLKKFAPAAKQAAAEGRGGIVHFDILPKNINKVVQVDIAVEGDVVDNLGKLLPMVESLAGYRRPEWFAKIADWKRKYSFTYEREATPDSMLKPQTVLEELRRQIEPMKDRTVITTGVGQHQMWAAQYLNSKYPRKFVSSGGLGTMGFGIPAAIGAKAADRSSVVVAIDGDACFCMTGMELATAVQYKLGIKVLILNNEFQGMVKQWQDLFYDKRYSGTEMVNPDFVKLAEAMGAAGIRARTPRELPEAMHKFIHHDSTQPIVFDARVDKAEHILPMCPAGRALHELVLPNDEKIDPADLPPVYNSTYM
ncbi:acetolactate synthase [Ramicandelaber brevisporus]|nr:acetolactate synthase [Ramicandelaber brevisporus]